MAPLINGSTRLYGIIGWPVHHSASPRMQTAALQDAGLDAAYVPFPVESEQLRAAVAGLWALGVCGANVTSPHKESVLAHLPVIDDFAAVLGAVNTLVRRAEGGFVGHNTDAAGFVRSLRQAKLSPQGRRVTVLGAGGAARAAVAGLVLAGAGQLTVCARREAQSAQLLADLRQRSAHLLAQPRHSRTGSAAESWQEVDHQRLDSPAVTTAPWHKLEALLPTTDILVQSTSATLVSTPAQASAPVVADSCSADPKVSAGKHNDRFASQHQRANAFVDSLPLRALPKHAAVVDLVYKPRDTALLERARAFGYHTLDGLGMLLHQGTLAFELWTGRPAPVQAMARALTADM